MIDLKSIGSEIFLIIHVKCIEFSFSPFTSVQPTKWLNPAQKMKFSIKSFFSRSDQIRSFLRIWSYLLKKSLMENLIFLFSEKTSSAYDLLKTAPNIFTKFAKKQLCWSLSLIKLLFQNFLQFCESFHRLFLEHLRMANFDCHFLCVKQMSWSEMDLGLLQHARWSTFW